MRENGGHAVALHWSMRNLYGINPGEVTKHFQSSISSNSLSDYDLYIHDLSLPFSRSGGQHLILDGWLGIPT